MIIESKMVAMQCFHLHNGGYLVAMECDIMPRLFIHLFSFYFSGVINPEKKLVSHDVSKYRSSTIYFYVH